MQAFPMKCFACGKIINGTKKAGHLLTGLFSTSDPLLNNEHFSLTVIATGYYQVVNTRFHS